MTLPGVSSRRRSSAHGSASCRGIRRVHISVQQCTMSLGGYEGVSSPDQTPWD